MRGRMTGSGGARPPDLLEPLGEPDDRDVVDAELVEGALRGGDLGRPAVDDDQARRVGELAGPTGVGVDQGRTPLLGRLAEVEPGVLGPLVEQPPEPPGDRLVHRRHVVLTVEAADHEAAVVALARQPVLEHHHRRDDLGALQVGHVVALDPQRRLGQVERLLELLERPAAGGEVAGPLRLVQGEGLRRVAGDGLHQGALVAPSRDPQGHLAAALVTQPRGERCRRPRAAPARAPPAGSRRPPRRRTPG